MASEASSIARTLWRPRAVAFFFVVLLAVGLFSSGVAAHAYLDEPTPAEGEQLDAPPEEVLLGFTGDGIELAEVTVRGPDGTTVSEDPRIDAEDRSTVTVPLTTDALDDDELEGMYIVEWEVLADDGHTTSGTYFFAVGDEPLDRDGLLAVYADSEDDSGSGVEAVANGLVLLSVIGFVGIPLTMWVVVTPAARRFDVPVWRGDGTVTPGQRRLMTLLSGAGIALCLGVIALGLARSTAVGGERSVAAFLEFLSTSLGAVWLGQLVVVAIVAAVLLAWRWGRISGEHALIVGVAGGLAIQLTISWTSHSASVAGRLSGLAVDFAHIGGAALWLGGLAVLGLVVPPLLRFVDDDRRRGVINTAVRRYSLLAMTGVLLAVVTGLVMTAWHVPDTASLSETLYGLVLSTKTVLVVLALGLGGFVRFVLLKRLEAPPGHRSKTTAETGSRKPLRQDGGHEADDSTRTLIRAVHLELVLLIGVVLLSGLLTSVPTAAMAEEETETATFTTQVEGIDLELTVLPAIEAHDRAYVDEGEPMIVDVQLSSEGEPVSAEDGLSLYLQNDIHDASTQVDLEETDDGTYSTVQTLPEPETWEIRVDGWVDGVYVSEWFEVYVIVDDPAHQHDDHDHDHGGGPFATLLRMAALAIGVTGGFTIAISAMRFDQREGSES